MIAPGCTFRYLVSEIMNLHSSALTRAWLTFQAQPQRLAGIVGVWQTLKQPWDFSSLTSGVLAKS
ncbi:hypothetical protein C8R42DRAFT_688087 [Lentinula raphanica]|nr:hypothetical protein C8R42DRAFT_688087 [Lentinula raphanica]